MKSPKILLLIALFVGIYAIGYSETININCKPIPGAYYPIAEFDSNSRDCHLLSVPGYTWSYGCGAMVMAYYDRLPNTLYPNIYTGSTNNGVMPAYNGCWGPGNPGSQSENPLCASHNGIDGYIGRGHIDDYWTDEINGSHPNPDPDPYILNNWTPHTSNCVADFMGTSRSTDNQIDGGTRCHFNANGSALYLSIEN